MKEPEAAPYNTSGNRGRCGRGPTVFSFPAARFLPTPPVESTGEKPGRPGDVMEKETFLTPEGLRRLEEELEYLKTVKRKEVAERIKQAKAFGDLSENSEYEDAKNEQAFVEGRILALEQLLRNAKVIQGNGASGEVAVGSRVRVRDLASGEEYEYWIVGSAEADPSQARISNESPVGRALLGRRPGEVVEVQVPAGFLRLQITGLGY